jgi:probable rRNA maturation factor
VIILQEPLEGVSSTALARFASQAQRLAGVQGEVAVLITGNQHLRKLNRQFRKKDAATDVLSFPREDGGDIAVSAQIAAKNALDLGHDLNTELKVLILHGMLHLAGFDHETDKGEMAAREAVLRKKLKLPDSLISRAAARASRRRP